MIGQRLGPYEITAKLGEGGMGEVYRATDSRLRREVAIKVLPAAFTADQERLARFEREAQVLARLQHPNIASIFGLEESEGVLALVMELVEGEDLSLLIARGPLAPAEALPIAKQIAEALEAAHEQGIVHRDLKPANIKVRADTLAGVSRTVKVLDFGLAKALDPAARSAAEMAHSPTLTAHATQMGIILGTAAYMAPEQARGQAVDRRADIWAFGVVLYEMLSGRSAFAADTVPDTLAAVLTRDVDWSRLPASTPPAIVRLLERCLERDPRDRLRDVADARLELQAAMAPARRDSAAAAPARRPPRRLAWLALAAGILLAIAAGVAGRLVRTPVSVPTFQRLTFERGIVDAARFAPDGQTIVYGAAWNGRPFDVFTARADSTEARALGLRHASVLALSSSGELALNQERHAAWDVFWNVGIGTLARAPLAGGAPHAVTESVLFADYTPDGREMAVVRQLGRRVRLEYPVGKVLFETAGWIGNPRISPRGDLVAFLDHAAKGESGGSVAVVDRQGRKTVLSTGFIRTNGLAWSARGDEVWFTATRAGSAQALYAATLDGRERLVLRVPGALTLHDIARDGRLLLSTEDFRRELRVSAPGETVERDLSWLDYASLCGISADGSLVGFAEWGEAGGATHQAYVRKTDGSPPVRLGDANCADLSRDGKWVLALPGFQSTAMRLIPTGTGEPRALPTEALDLQSATFFPDAKHILISANPPGKPLRTYVQDLAGGKARAITPEGTSEMLPEAGVMTADGRFFVARDPEGRAVLWPVEGGEPRAIPGFDSNEDGALVFPQDGHTLLVYRFRELPMPIVLLDLVTGHRETWRVLAPPDATGVVAIDGQFVTPDLRAYAYHYVRRQSNLFLVEGLK